MKGRRLLIAATCLVSSVWAGDVFDGPQAPIFGASTQDLFTTDGEGGAHQYQLFVELPVALLVENLSGSRVHFIGVYLPADPHDTQVIGEITWDLEAMQAQQSSNPNQFTVLQLGPNTVMIVIVTPNEVCILVMERGNGGRWTCSQHECTPIQPGPAPARRNAAQH